MQAKQVQTSLGLTCLNMLYMSFIYYKQVVNGPTLLCITMKHSSLISLKGVVSDKFRLKVFLHLIVSHNVSVHGYICIEEKYFLYLQL